MTHPTALPAAPERPASLHPLLTLTGRFSLAEALAALDAEATDEQFDDDGRLFHGRLPSEDRDAFNPCVVALAEVA